MQTTKCRKCSSDLPENSRFCLSCGAPVISDSSATETVATSSPSSSTPSSKLRSSTSSSDGRFLPGTLLAARYRIIAKLGQGGMGEVYRADDIVLGQAVALKFLPPEATDNPIALDRFRNEVKIARQISHPNVCRVYDLGEIDGQLFLSMEYVDGEDLGVLLRRIGLFIFRVLLRNRWLAAAVFVAIWTAIQTLGGDHVAINIPTMIAIYSIAALALVRFGLVTLAAAVFTADSLGNVPITLNPSLWYFSSTVFVTVAVLLLAAWAFKEATAGQKIFSADMFE